MPSGNSRGRRESKRNGCSEYCVTDHEGFRLVCLNRWVLQAVALQMHQQYRKNSGTNGPTHDFIVSIIILLYLYSPTCGCVDFILTSSLSYVDTMLHGSQPTGKIVLGISGKEFKSGMLSSCAVDYIRIEFPSDHYVAIAFIIF